MFFILTTGRSGSKSIASYLSSSPEIVCRHEPEPVLIEEASEYFYGNFPHEKMVELLRSTRQPEIEGRQYGESNQKLSFIIPAAIEAFPQLKFIWLIRDGRDVVNSTHSIGWYDNSLLQGSMWQEHLIDGVKSGDVSEEDWSAMDSFEKCCWYWSFTNNVIKNNLAQMDKSRWMVIRLEDIKYDDVFRFLSVPPCRKKVPWINKKRRLKESSGWRSWDDRQKHVFEKVCGPLMNEFYPGWIDSDNKWLEIKKVGPLSRLKHYFQNKLVSIPGKSSVLYRFVKGSCDFIFRSRSPVVLAKLDKVYRKLSGEE